MKVETECSCGARLAVEYEDTSMARASGAQQRADELVEKFRRDHKLCRVSAAAKDGS